MSIEILVLTVFLCVFMFAIGWIAGIDNEQKRIRRAFGLEGYTYEKFFEVLRKYEKLLNNEKNIY